MTLHFSLCRSSRPEVFCKECVFKNIAKFTGKRLCRSFFWPATLFKKRLRHRCFPVNFAKLLKTPFLIEQIRWLFCHHDLVDVDFSVFKGYNNETSSMRWVKVIVKHFKWNIDPEIWWKPVWRSHFDQNIS